MTTSRCLISRRESRTGAERALRAKQGTGNRQQATGQFRIRKLAGCRLPVACSPVPVFRRRLSLGLTLRLRRGRLLRVAIEQRQRDRDRLLRLGRDGLVALDLLERAQELILERRVLLLEVGDLHLV